MTDEQKAAYINSQVMCASIEVAAMAADNMTALVLKEVPKFGHDDFEALIEKYGLEHNNVVGFFHQ